MWIIFIFYRIPSKALLAGFIAKEDQKQVEQDTETTLPPPERMV